jgi:hypothetical protein
MPSDQPAESKGFLCPACEHYFLDPQPAGWFHCPACGARSPSVLPPPATRGESFVTQLIRELSDPRSRNAISNTGACDLCNNGIHDGVGHAFYSSKQRDGVTEGHMLLCGRCTSGIVSRLRDGHVSESNPLSGLFAPEYGEGDRMRKLQIAVLNSIEGIAECCRSHGLDPDAAKAKARELAENCRSNPTEGRMQSISFWHRKSGN